MASVARLIGVWAALLLTPLCACQREPHVPQFVSLGGRVVGRVNETRELTVKLASSDGIEAETVNCVVNAHSEIYINDRASGLDAVAIGDPLEIIGYRDRTARADTFVVVFAYVRRPFAAPPPPDLSRSAALQPAGLP